MVVDFILFLKVVDFFSPFFKGGEFSFLINGGEFSFFFLMVVDFLFFLMVMYFLLLLYNTLDVLNVDCLTFICQISCLAGKGPHFWK